MKKWISAILAVLIAVFALCPAAFAEETVITEEGGSASANVYVNTVGEPSRYTGDVKDGKADVEGPGFQAHADNVPDSATRLVVVPIDDEGALEWFNRCLPDGWGDTGIFYAVWFEDAEGNHLPANDVELSVDAPEGYDPEDLQVYAVSADGTPEALDSDISGGSIKFKSNGYLYYGVTHHLGTVTEETEVSPGAPDTTLDMTPDELADAVFTDEDRKFIEDGVDIHLRLTVEDITKSVPEADKLAVLSVAGDYTVGEYIDIELLKRIGDRDWVNIHETRTPVRITVHIPESLLGVVGRSFAIVRVHGNGAQFLEDLDTDPTTITFDTDEFSTYAILYRDPAPGPGPGPKPEPEPEPGPKPGPQTGDPSSAAPWIALAILTAAATVCTAAHKKKKTK